MDAADVGCSPFTNERGRCCCLVKGKSVQQDPFDHSPPVTLGQFSYWSLPQEASMSPTPLLAAGLVVGLVACAESPTAPTERPLHPEFAQNQPCPDGFSLVPGPGEPADKNGNLLVCRKAGAGPNGFHLVDDKLG
jgi:hypothetical protein